MSKWLDERADGSFAFFIDGDLQFDSRDERIYHESLALPALALSSMKAKSLRALIVGGGDGLTARELLKSPHVVQIDLVDYDPDVVELARTRFSDLNCNSMANPRLSVHTEDAWDFVSRLKQRIQLSQQPNISDEQPDISDEQPSISDEQPISEEQPSIFDASTLAEPTAAEVVTLGLVSPDVATKYDIIIVDLTVAEDASSARFHSVEWYEMLHSILAPAGVLATNGVSPSATAEAYFSIFNAIRTAGLHAVPYRCGIPSFIRLNYGMDWGFFLASTGHSIAGELRGELPLAGDRHSLRDGEHLRKLFEFPVELLQVQSTSRPASDRSDIFLHYLFNPADQPSFSGQTWNALEADLDALPLPAPDIGRKLLPAPIRDFFSQDEAKEYVVAEVLELMPALHSFQTQEMIAEFLEDPGAFFESIDFVGLVDELLKRTSELPEKIVAELNKLKQWLADWAGDYSSLVELGGRFTAIVAVVVILANLLYPDSVFAKGDHADGHAGGHGYGHGATTGRGRIGLAGRGRDGDWGHWNDWGGRWGHWGGWARPYHRWWCGGWGGWIGWAPWVGWATPVAAGVNLNINAVDEQGNQYPPRTYNCSPTLGVQEYGADQSPQTPPSSTAPEQATAQNTKGVYRLGPDTDILPDGRTVMQLTNNAYLHIASAETQVVDQATGVPVMGLYSDPSLNWHLANEVQRQQKKLEAAIQSRRGGLDASDNPSFQGMKDESQKDLVHMNNVDKLLESASGKLGTLADSAPSAEKAPVQGAIEVFTSVWMTHDGNWLLIKRPNGSIAYMNGHGWYSDQGKAKLPDPYPQKFKTVVAAYLTNLTNESASTLSKMQHDKQEAQQHLQKLNQELQTLLPPENGQGPAAPSSVQFGADTVEQPEALRRTKLAIRRAQHRLDFISKELESVPDETAAANKLLAQFNA